MRYLKYITLLIAFATMMWLATSCVNEDNSNCVQYAITTQLVDKKGDVLPDSTVGKVKAYLFLNNKFDHIVTAESDGKYLISFDGNAKATLVAFGNTNSDSVSIYTPNEGDDISTISVGLLATRSSAGYFSSPTYLYYGRFDYTSTASGSTTTALLPMYNQHARVHVVAKHLQSQFGDGNYQIELQGFRNAITFDGTITGDSVRYSLNGTFDNSDIYTSKVVNTLPTKTDEYVTVLIYKDGTLLWKTSTDANGNKVTLAAEDDTCFVIDVQKIGIGMQVMSWNDYQQSTVIY
jgi:hypothetical protein